MLYASVAGALMCSLVLGTKYIGYKVIIRQTILGSITTFLIEKITNRYDGK
jgi:hypothetical protein